MENKVQIKLNTLMQYLFEKIGDANDVGHVMYLISAYTEELIKKIKSEV
jgi:hypothetical protein